MIVFIVFLVVGAVAGAIYLGKRQREKTHAAWAHAAGILGLAFTPPPGLAHRRMSGRINGLEVDVYTVTRGSGDSKSTYTHYDVAYPAPLGLGLKLTKQGFFSGVAKFFGSQDIEVGDKTFDDAVVVKGHDVARVIEFLTPSRRYLIHRLFQSRPAAVVEDDDIYWEALGAQGDATQLIQHVRSLVKVAAELTGVQNEPRYNSALAELQAGHLDKALEIAREIPDPPALPDPEARLLQGQALFTNRQYRETADVLAELEPIAALDAGVAELQVAATQLAIEVEESSGTIDLTDNQPPATPPDEVETPDAATTCADLFDEDKTTLDTGRAFETRYLNTLVRWEGTLARVEDLGFDMVFGTDPGTVATIAIYEMPTGTYSGRKVHALVQLPKDAGDALKERLGDTIAFAGTLIRCDAFMRNLYVAAAEVSED